MSDKIESPITPEAAQAIGEFATTALGIVNHSPVADMLRGKSLGREIVEGRAHLTVAITLPAGPIEMFLALPGKEAQELHRIELPGPIIRGFNS